MTGQRLAVRGGALVMGAVLAIGGTALTVSASAQEARFVVPALPGGEFRIDIGTMLDRRFYTVVRQQYDFSCGSAALATLLRYHYGVQANEETTFNGMWDKGDQQAIRKSGFSLLDMKRYLGSLGLNTDGYRITLEQVAQTRVPGIALVVTRGYRHFVVIKGVSRAGVLVGDPARGLMRLPRGEFEKIWDGLYFVITDAPATGRRSFNRAAQWTSVTRAPLDGRFTLPVEPEVLRLATPALLFGEL